MTTVSEILTPVRPAASERHVLGAVIRRCLRDQRRSPLTWGIPLGLMSALELAIYPSVEKSMGKLMESYPDALKEAFRIETMDTPAQFLNGEMYSLIIPLAVAFFAIRAATRPIVGAEERHWLETVLAAPVRRRTLAAGAFVAAGITSVLILLVMSAITWLAGVIAGAVVPAGAMLAGVAGTWPLVMFFAGFALLLSGRLTSWGAVTGIAAGVLVGMYVLDVTARISDALEPVGPASVFHWYGPAIVDGVDWAACAGVMAVALLLAAAGMALFERRDIRS